jgi:hypothetical protein
VCCSIIVDTKLSIDMCCVCVCLCVCVCVCMCAYMCLYMPMCVCVCVCVCVAWQLRCRNDDLYAHTTIALTIRSLLQAQIACDYVHTYMHCCRAQDADNVKLMCVVVITTYEEVAYAYAFKRMLGRMTQRRLNLII